MSAPLATCRAPGCVDDAPEYVAFGPYSPHDWRYHLCPQHMRDVRAATIAVLRAPAEVSPPSAGASVSPTPAPMD